MLCTVHLSDNNVFTMFQPQQRLHLNGLPINSALRHEFAATAFTLNATNESASIIFKCVRIPTKSPLSLTHYANKSSRCTGEIVMQLFCQHLAGYTTQHTGTDLGQRLANAIHRLRSSELGYYCLRI